MKVISAYMLAVLGGNNSPAAGDITKILSSVGIEADSDRVSALLKALEGKDLNEVITAGLEKVGAASASSGGGGGGAAAGGGGDAESESESSSSGGSSDGDFGGGLFD